MVAPSEEDSQTFTVNGANGEVYKLRGQGAKERQHWVSRLRREVENCNQSYNMGAREAAVSFFPHQPSFNEKQRLRVDLQLLYPK